MLRTAFRFLTYDRTKMFGVLAGIIISVVLIGQQMSIFNSMMDNARGLAKTNPEYVWVVNEKTQSAMQLLNLDVRVGRELQSIPGVQTVYPIVLASGSAKSAAGTKSSVQLIGIQAPAYKGGAVRYTTGTNLNELINEGAVIIDQTFVPLMDSIRVGDYFTINDQRVYVSGMSVGMTGFGSSYVITTLERARKLTSLSVDYVNAYFVAVDTTRTTRQQVIARINGEISQVRAVEGTVLGDETLQYMLTTSNIAASFGILVIFAVVTGFVIVGLTQYSSVNDRIRDYGTIKAIGGSNGLIRRLILIQGGLYAILGFAIAYGLLLLMQLALSGGQLEVRYSGVLIGGLIGFTLFISLASSLIALRKITQLEPVQIFRM